MYHRFITFFLFVGFGLALFATFLGIPIAYAATFVVNSTGDGDDSNTADSICNDGTGSCTLRAAIHQANVLSGTDTINFNIGAGGLQTISPTTQMETISSVMIIDGTSQPGFTSAPLIELSGASLPTGHGLTIASVSGVTVRGLIINRFNGAAISGSPSNSFFDTNYIGSNAAGDTASANTGLNAIAQGISFTSGSGNTIGAATATGRNVFGGAGTSKTMIYIAAGSNTIQNNYIGVNAAGTGALGTMGIGIDVGGGTSNTIGGDGSQYRNVIATGSSSAAIRLFGGGISGAAIQGNYIGTNAAGTAKLTSGGISLTSISNTTIGGNTAGKRNVIANSNGDRIFVSGSTNITIQGNYIGTNAAGTAGLSGSSYGVDVATSGATNSVKIGGTGDGEGNVISANATGIGLSGSAAGSATVQGNYIGTNATGTSAIANTQKGILIQGSITGQIGGNTSSARNIISGNTGGGIYFSSATGTFTIQGNYIGLNAAGTSAIANGANGISADGVSSITLGGTGAGEGNVVSGNTSSGISVINSNGAGTRVVQGNIVGLNAAGTASVSNGLYGINLSGTTSTLIGGTTVGATNIISGNTSEGIYIALASASGNTIQNNKIGTGTAGTETLGNSQHGIFITSSAGGSNIIGGTGTREANITVNNGAGGIAIAASGSVDNKISGNTISANTGLGIDLGTAGVTANDALDSDTGSNNLQNFPVISAATNDATVTHITGTLVSTASSVFSIEFFSNTACDLSGNGEGEVYLTTTSVTTNESGDGSFTVDLSPQVAVGKFITATARDASNNTSEFSACGAQAQVTSADMQITSFTVDNAAPRQGATVAYTIAIKNAGSSSATAASVTNTLPTSLTYVSSTPSQGSYTPGTGVWSVGTLALNATATIVIRATVNSGIPSSTITHTATFSSEIGDPDTSNNSSSVNVRVYEADLSVSLSVNHTNPRQGDEIVFTLTAHNSGPDDAPSVLISDSVPNHLTFVSSSPSQGTYNSISGLWSIGALADGASVTLAIHATVDSAIGKQTISNTAGPIVSDIDDNTSGNNITSADIFVAQAELAVVSKTVTDETPKEGQSIVYTITVQNNGPDNAPNTQLTDVLPVGLTYKSSAQDVGSYDSGSGIWSIGTLANGTRAVLEIYAQVNADVGSATVTNATGIITSDIDDDVSGNNSASVSIRIYEANLQIVGVHADTQNPREQQSVVYSFSVKNDGPDDAPGVQVLASLPSEFSFDSASASRGAYDSATTVWSIGSVAAGTSETLTVHLAVNYGTGGKTPIIAISNLFSDIDEANDSDNHATLQISIANGESDLAIVRHDVSNALPKEGDVVVYTITVQNNGPDSARSVALDDQASDAVVYEQVSASQGSFDMATGHWTIGALGNAQQASILITARVKKGSGSTVVTSTTGSLVSDKSDPNSENNTRSISFRVEPSRPYIATIPGPRAPQSTVHVGPLVRVFTRYGAQVSGLGNFYAFDKAYEGGGYLAIGDVDGDGANEIVIGQGTGKERGKTGAQSIRVFRPTGERVGSDIYPFEKAFDGGITVAVGDVDGDGANEIGACKASRGKALCKVMRFGGKQEVLASWNAFGDFGNGATISFGDIDGDGRAEAIVGAGPTGSTRIRIYDIGSTPITGTNKGASLKPIQYNAFSPQSRSGISVTAGDIDRDGKVEIVGAQLDTREEGWVKVYRYNKEKTAVSTFRAYAKDSNTGAWVRAKDIDGDDKADIITGGGDNGGPQIRGFTLKGYLKTIHFFAYDKKFRGGVWFDVGVLRR